MGQLFGYLFEYQEEDWSYWTFCVRKTFNTKTIELFRKTWVWLFLLCILRTIANILWESSRLGLFSIFSHSLKSFRFFTSYFNIFLDSTSTPSKASSNFVPSDSAPTFSNETESQSTSSNAIISIYDKESEPPESKETPSPLTYETPKQDEINKQIKVEKEINCFI